MMFWVILAIWLLPSAVLVLVSLATDDKDDPSRPG